MKLHSISKNVAATLLAVNKAVSAAHRNPVDIHVVAASKTKPAADIEAAYAAGLTDFGENYLQEAIPKIHSLANLPLTWHFIGAIQSNKTRLIAENFHWVHTVDRSKIARRLSAQCPTGKTLEVCLQVNIDKDPGKAGVLPGDAVSRLLDDVANLPGLRLRGLMTILESSGDPLGSYQRLAELFSILADRAPRSWDALSMGMSKDYAQAIMAGATHIRVGTGIFGPRADAVVDPPKPSNPTN
jgi:pyridoxal phosphate enzyme (YggS family)